MRIRDLATGAVVRELTGHPSGIKTMTAFVDAGGHVVLATGSHGEHEVRLWDPSTGEQLVVLPGHLGGVNAIEAFTGSEGQVLLAAGGGDRTVRVWDLRARRELIRLVVAAPVETLHVVRASVSGGRQAAGYLAIGGPAGVAVVEITPAP
ncbi:hypothetical protein [Amycolatopsis sp. CA-126428]|uniref:hypothetical protein n=1 Tax=Amycolatopsis sp. CA-126428 TaxID=2073158 RepID=UPI000CD28085|nr:hypothetical protein [Amycolatopsis sp. CA-126428]